MITKDWLLEQAEAAEATMKAHALPSGTLQNETWRQARVLRDQALNAAQWLEDMGLQERHQVGPFGGKPIAKGQKVRIKMGTVIRSMHPRYDWNNPKVAKRTYAITVYDVHNGTINSHWHDHQVESAARDQEVMWPGEGGYWCYTSSENVEL